MSGTWLTKEAREHWGNFRNTSGSNTDLFIPPTDCQDMALNWKWMIGLLDLFTHLYRFTITMLDYVERMEAVQIKTPDISGIQDMIEEILYIFRKQPENLQISSALLKYIVNSLFKGPGTRTEKKERIRSWNYEISRYPLFSTYNDNKQDETVMEVVITLMFKEQQFKRQTN